MPSLSILLVDDHELVRRGLRSLLSAREDWSICAEAVDGFDAVEKAKSLRPNVVLMDITMPRMDGMQATRIIRREVPESAVIIISQNDPALGRRMMAEADAHAFVAKEDASRELLPTIDALFDSRNPECSKLHEPLPARPSTRLENASTSQTSDNITESSISENVDAESKGESKESSLRRYAQLSMKKT